MAPRFFWAFCSYQAFRQHSCLGQIRVIRANPWPNMLLPFVNFPIGYRSRNACLQAPFPQRLLPYPCRSASSAFIRGKSFSLESHARSAAPQ